MKHLQLFEEHINESYEMAIELNRQKYKFEKITDKIDELTSKIDKLEKSIKTKDDRK